MKEKEYKEKLTPDQYHILREKGTERPFTGEYNTHYDKGVYSCAACGNELFKSDQKFDSGCGWPSFDDEVEGAIERKRDTTHGMMRTEIMCSNCGSHLGHVFNDGPTPTGIRHCVNSLSLDFKKED
ncbi:MAG: peptide-methionine (R)-S-oxide reductase [Nonlabens sp.]|jgi:peptide-methionine (R)-S-oxide reductase|uniref:peptide-methionine (R)-S-oxide reductase MsrB n=1 Tax=Nonlabens sp. MB-3u-79 TaxID=2058134 RepID=UPI000C30C88E|nr:peptide-methionine (R)-S-oxide reductase MsrB [Nonlabens sp. MB-3u-79]AUC80305.1 peptide-methionine (R)-S-oxide reductase [Nonlabens sp. MB-3u-79]|tara:strand:+ start:9129 stop:9506 length:378 start_codon:yes stop_codon:yes gene_type:complete